MNAATRQYCTDQITEYKAMLDRVEAIVCKWHADMMAGFDRLLEKINETKLSMKENAEVALAVNEMEKDFGALSEARGRDEDCRSGKDRRRRGGGWLNGLVGDKNRLDQGCLQLNVHAIRTWELRYSGRYTDSRSWTCAISKWYEAESVVFNNEEEFRTYQNHVAIPIF